MMQERPYTANWRNIMIDMSEILQLSPYGLPKEEKQKLFTERLCGLTTYHKEHCVAYGNVLDGLQIDVDKVRHTKNCHFYRCSYLNDTCVKISR